MIVHLESLQTFSWSGVLQFLLVCCICLSLCLYTLVYLVFQKHLNHPCKANLPWLCIVFNNLMYGKHSTWLVIPILPSAVSRSFWVWLFLRQLTKITKNFLPWSYSLWFFPYTHFFLYLLLYRTEWDGKWILYCAMMWAWQ